MPIIDQGPVKLQLLKDGWAFDLFEKNEWKGVANAGWRAAPWNCSWWHKCLNSQYYNRTDYIKNINSYLPQGNNPAKIQRGLINGPGPVCWHCGTLMPTKYVRLFQAFFLNERLKHGLSVKPTKFYRERI